MSSLDHHLFPKTGSLKDQIFFCLTYVVRAPSTHNSQPWLFDMKDEKIFLYADNSRRLPEGDKDGRDLYISLGACLEHLSILLRHFRMGGEVTYGDLADKSGFVAALSVHSSEGRDETLLPMVQAIEKRFNARGPFLPKEIPDEAWTKLAALGEDETTLHLYCDRESIATLAALTAEGMREVHARTPFRAELSRWMTNNYSARKDGIPGYSMLAPNILSLILPFVIRLFNMGAVLAKLNTKAITSAPAMGILTSVNDKPASWMRAGMLFERASLLLNSYDIYTSIYVASVEVPKLRGKLREHFAFTQFPQFTFAFGYPKITLKQPPRHDPASRFIA